MMKSQKSRVLLGVVLLLIGGLYLADHLFLQKRGIASFDGRATSSVGTDYYDLSEASDKEFSRLAKYALIQGLQVHKTQESMGLSLGLFLVKNESGSKVYACEKYPNVEIVLQAEGVAYSGDVPTILMRGPCMASDDGQRILPLTMPLKGLHKNLRENPMLKLPLGDRGESVMLSAQTLYEEWPHYWNVVGIKLYNDQESVSLDGYEIISLLDQALTLDFSEVQ
ncbi:hypothetical protein [Bdellovibrio sp. HCB337]|uniref:hypothetical protein n=1 Tax=Bdellovibrio sp. HCB337 TaxID=3394358 RepID=UPI0039A6BA1A